MKTTKEIYERIRTMWIWADYTEGIYISMCEISMDMVARGEY